MAKPTKPKRPRKSRKPKLGAEPPAAARDEPPLLCGVPPEPEEPPLPRGLAAPRLFAIMATDDIWQNNTVLHYYFVDRGPGQQSQMVVVRRAFAHWKAQGIGLEFREVDDPRKAEIRITFRGTTSWSYVGKNCLKYPSNQATMNFGWDLRTDWGWATALHEIGHALGMPHEHQNPNAGIQWDVARVYRTYGGPPNKWNEEKIRENVLKKMSPLAVRGSKWDPASIMHYPFAPGLITAPKPYDTKGTPKNMRLSSMDIDVIRKCYPAKTAPRLMATGSAPLPTAVGAQADFVIEPKETRTYTLEAGGVDARLVLFEDYKGEPVYLSADDNAGTGKKASLRLKLHQGRKYIARVRTRYAEAGQKPTFYVA